MASRMIGRTACPECGFAAAHVKQSDKCLYRYCPECGSQHHARSERQRVDLTSKTRMLDEPTPTPTPTPTPSATPTQEPSPTPSGTATHTEQPSAMPTATPTAKAATARRGLFA
jgi:hypothetical protein